MLALAVNGEMAGEEGRATERNLLPSEEEIEEEIATASQTLGFDLRSELFDLLGGEFIAFSSFPTFDTNGFGRRGRGHDNRSGHAGETARKIAAAIERSDGEADVRTRGGWRHHLRRERPGDGRGAFARIWRGR